MAGPTCRAILGILSCAALFLFRRRLHEAEHPLLARDGDPDSDDDLVVRERVAIEKQHQPQRIIVPTLMQRT